jgi:predicted CXXCH cytochrome family protein
MPGTARPNADGGRTGRGGSVLWLVAIAVLLLVAAAHGCTAEKRYKVLSVFFDGVPDPNAPKVVEGQSQRTMLKNGQVVQIVVYTHKPYGENKCAACHGETSGSFESFQKVGSTVCLTCHKNVPNEFPVMHGPVAAVECTICHHPHESTVPHLLREAPPAVCTQCHVPELLSPTPPEHLMPDKSCLDCHVGHGGPAHKLLRAQAPSTRPAAGKPAGAGA